MTHYYEVSYMDSQVCFHFHAYYTSYTLTLIARRSLPLIVALLIMLPFIAAVLIPFIYRRFKNIHLGWFVLVVPVALFSILATYIPRISNGKTFVKHSSGSPHFDINITTYLDGLSMIFSLLITGVGSLVILFHFYLSTKESLHHFYCYLLLFMGAMLRRRPFR